MVYSSTVTITSQRPCYRNCTRSKVSLSANVLVRSIENETEVIVATVWDSLDPVKAFAGEDHNVAVVEPIVRDLLNRFDDRVTHFTVAVAT